MPNVTTAAVFFNRWFNAQRRPEFLVSGWCRCLSLGPQGRGPKIVDWLSDPQRALVDCQQLTRTVMQLCTSKYPASLDVLWSIGMSMILLFLFLQAASEHSFFLSVAILAAALAACLLCMDSMARGMCFGRSSDAPILSDSSEEPRYSIVSPSYPGLA